MKREYNRAACELAQLARNGGVPQVWVGVSPLVVHQEVVQADYS